MSKSALARYCYRYFHFKDHGENAYYTAKYIRGAVRIGVDLLKEGRSGTFRSFGERVIYSSLPTLHASPEG